jgi:hypothetical protein
VLTQSGLTSDIIRYYDTCYDCCRLFDSPSSLILSALSSSIYCSVAAALVCAIDITHTITLHPTHSPLTIHLIHTLNFTDSLSLSDSLSHSHMCPHSPSYSHIHTPSHSISYRSIVGANIFIGTPGRILDIKTR